MNGDKKPTGIKKIVKLLRKAMKSGDGITLTFEDVLGIVEAFHVLRENHDNGFWIPIAAGLPSEDGIYSVVTSEKKMGYSGFIDGQWVSMLYPKVYEEQQKLEKWFSIPIPNPDLETN